MVFKTRIFRGDKGIDYILRNLVEIGINAVSGTVVITPHLLTIGGVYDRSKAVVRIFQFLDRRHITNDSIISHHEKDNNNCNQNGKANPHALDPF